MALELAAQILRLAIDGGGSVVHAFTFDLCHEKFLRRCVVGMCHAELRRRLQTAGRQTALLWLSSLTLGAPQVVALFTNAVAFKQLDAATRIAPVPLSMPVPKHVPVLSIASDHHTWRCLDARSTDEVVLPSTGGASVLAVTIRAADLDDTIPIHGNVSSLLLTRHASTQLCVGAYSGGDTPLFALGGVTWCAPMRKLLQACDAGTSWWSREVVAVGAVPAEASDRSDFAGIVAWIEDANSPIVGPFSMPLLAK